jgi:hypothetical protein
MGERTDSCEQMKARLPQPFLLDVSGGSSVDEVALFEAARG